MLETNARLLFLHIMQENASFHDAKVKKFLNDLSFTYAVQIGGMLRSVDDRQEKKKRAIFYFSIVNANNVFST